MARTFALVLAALAGTAAKELLDRNLAYASPFADLPFHHDTRQLHARQVRISRRQVADASKFTDNHYTSFYSGEYGKSPFVWSGGVNFTHAVASGDPFDKSVLLWTRAVPTAGKVPEPTVPICVAYTIYEAASQNKKSADQGQAFTTAEVDWTVKVEALNLKPDTKYTYQFSDCTNVATVSPIGQTRTLPSPDTPANQVNGGKPLTMAVFSCSQYQTGWFNAYGVAAKKTNADIFVHLGDYIYEYASDGSDIGRDVSGFELATISDYRLRLNTYRADAYLLGAHLAGPWITVWDDHEVADNTWKAGSADSNDTKPAGCMFSPSGACFTERKLAAIRAYHEWMPIRQIDIGDKLRIWRNFQFGKLLDLTMLDTRQYDRDVTDLYYNTDYIKTIKDNSNRTLMGTPQETWFHNTLTQSKARGATWRVVGQQIVFNEINMGTGFNLDAWDGYTANRKRVLDHIRDNKIDNTVILAGDSHASWVSDLSYPGDKNYDSKTGKGSLAVEFAGTAVSSHSPLGEYILPFAADAVSKVLVTLNPDLQWSEAAYRGFFTLTITPEIINATYYAMSNVKTQNLDSFVASTFSVKKGENKLSRPISKVKAGAVKTFLF